MLLEVLSLLFELTLQNVKNCADEFSYVVQLPVYRIFTCAAFLFTLCKVTTNSSTKETYYDLSLFSGLSSYTAAVEEILIGVSMSEPHTSLFNCDFFISYILLSGVRRFRISLTL